MSETVKMRALIERAKRHWKKKNGTILHKHKIGTKDYLMNGNLFVYTVDPESNSIDWYSDYNDFIDICKDEGILKDGEEAE